MHSWNACLAASLLALGGALSPSPEETHAHSVQDEEPTEVAPEKAPRPKNAEELFREFGRLRGLEVAFEEEKYLALLVEPLTTSGTLYFLAPGYLTRRVQKPRPSMLRIGPKELRMSGPDGEEVLDLRKNEAVRVFVTSLVRIFAGQREELERSFELAYAHDAESETDWTLTLTPRAKPLTEMVKRLKLSGTGRAVRSLEVFEPNGDRSVTRLLDANPERTFSAEEQAELFGIETPEGE